MKLKNAIVALAAAGALSTQALAGEAQVQQVQTPAQPLAAFTEADLQVLFDNAGQPMQLAVLSSQEMRATEGQALWFAPVVIHMTRVGLPHVLRIAHHPAHHKFGSLGRLPHIQFNVYRPGVSGSGRELRIPLPNTPFFRP